METGKEIGRGAWRVVYEHPDDPGLVIKKITLDYNKLTKEDLNKIKDGYNPNLQEWLIWQKYKKTRHWEILCPCVSISEDHRFLVMKRALNTNRKYIWKLPREIRDYRCTTNWGILGNRVVIIDYGDVVKV
jgi:hypothetical protein